MTKVKICGITNRKEICFLNRYLPDYAGFVFARSRRQITAEQAAELGKSLDPRIRRVGVFVDLDIGLTAETAEKAGLDIIQLHGIEDAKYIRTLRTLLKPGTEIWKAFRIDAGHMPEPGFMEQTEADRVLLDTYVAGTSGGTGRIFDWSLAGKLGASLPIILAGGLNPDNVERAVGQVRPYAVDTSSGVETDGTKDEGKLKAFLDKVRGGGI